MRFSETGYDTGRSGHRKKDLEAFGRWCRSRDSNPERRMNLIGELGDDRELFGHEARLFAKLSIQAGPQRRGAIRLWRRQHR